MRKKKTENVCWMDFISDAVSARGRTITTYNVIDQTDEYYVVEGKDKELIAMRKCDCKVVTISGFVR